MKKTYTHEQVTYGFAGTWVFTAGTHEYRTDLPGGRPTADKVARIFNGSHKRTGAGLDNLGRANIFKIIGSVATS